MKKIIYLIIVGIALLPSFSVAITLHKDNPNIIITSEDELQNDNDGLVDDEPIDEPIIEESENKTNINQDEQTKADKTQLNKAETKSNVKAPRAVSAAAFTVTNTSGYSGFIRGMSARVNISGGSAGATYKLVWTRLNDNGSEDWSNWGVLIQSTTSKTININVPNVNGRVRFILDTIVGGEVSNSNVTILSQHDGKSLLYNPNTNVAVPDWIWGYDTEFRKSMTAMWAVKGKTLAQVTWADLYWEYGIGGGKYDSFTANNIGDVIYYMPNIKVVYSSRGSWKLPLRFNIFSKLEDLWVADNLNVTNENIQLNSLSTTLKFVHIPQTSCGGIAANLSRYPNLQNFEVGMWSNQAKFTSINLAGLTKLKHLGVGLAVNSFNDLVGFNSCRNLTEIGLTGVTLTNAQLSGFIGWHNSWVEIYLQYTGITSFPISISNQINLEVLAIHTNSLNTLPSLARCTKLNKLEIGGCQMTVRPVLPNKTIADLFEDGNFYSQSDSKLRLKGSSLSLTRGVEYNNANTIMNDFGGYLEANNTYSFALRAGHTYKLVPYGTFSQYFEDTNGDGSFTLRKNIYIPATVQARVMIDNAVYSDVFNIAVQNSMISVTVPTTITATIKPNQKTVDYNGNQSTDSTDTFISPSFTITNNGNAPVNISIKEITPKAGSIPIKNNNIFTDAGWKNLNKVQSSQNIAFGFVMDNTAQWRTVTNSNAWYTPGTKYNLGSLNGKASAQVHLKSKYGMSHENGKTISYNVVYEISY